MRNEVLLKISGMGYVKMQRFYGNPLYDSRYWGGGGGGAMPTNSIISMVLLILEH